MCAKNPMPGGSAWRGRATRPPWATARSSAASSEGDASRYTSVPLPDTWGAVPPGVFKASTVIFPDTHALRSRTYTAKTGYTYGLRGTPTTYLLEERLAALEGGRFCILSPSGLAAITNVNLGLLQLRLLLLQHWGEVVHSYDSNLSIASANRKSRSVTCFLS